MTPEALGSQWRERERKDKKEARQEGSHETWAVNASSHWDFWEPVQNEPQSLCLGRLVCFFCTC